MRTQDFIEKALRGTTKSTFCSSVSAHTNSVNGETTVYSYGYHYPLVKIIGGKAFVNDRGYSNTTSKHIGWAFSAAANIVGWDNVFHAPLVRGGGLDPVGIARGAFEEQDRLTKEMQAKKRKDTKVYEWLQTQYDRATATLKAVEGL